MHMRFFLFCSALVSWTHFINTNYQLDPSKCRKEAEENDSRASIWIVTKFSFGTQFLPEKESNINNILAILINEPKVPLKYKNVLKKWHKAITTLALSATTQRFDDDYRIYLTCLPADKGKLDYAFTRVDDLILEFQSKAASKKVQNREFHQYQMSEDRETTA